MTFPMKRADPDPLLLPHRPVRHVREREPEHRPHYPPPRVFFEREFEPGRVRQIRTTNDRLHVRLLVDGRERKAIRFDAADVDALERAIECSKREDVATCRRIASIPLKTGDAIDVGAQSGAVLLRIRRADGSKPPHVRLEGDELVALVLALAHFKQVTAPRGAVSQEG